MVIATLDKLNSIHPMIQFTMEEEVDGAINYLDITICHSHNGGGFLTKWYHKPMASNRILNFYSNHPRHVVLNTAKNFIRRVFQLSSACFHADYVTKIVVILEKNNFPSKFIGESLNKIRALHNSHQSFTNTTSNVTSMNLSLLFNSTAAPEVLDKTMVTGPAYSSLSYVPGLSESLVKQLEYFIPEVTIASKPVNKLSLLFTNSKDKVAVADQSGCVYSIPCKDCDKMYVGETIQRVGTRTKQHQYDVDNAHKVNKPTTALVKHVKATKHDFDFDGVHVLCRERIKRRLQLQEVNHIVMNEARTCNFKEDTDGVTPMYHNLLVCHRARSTLQQQQHSSTHQHQRTLLDVSGLLDGR